MDTDPYSIIKERPGFPDPHAGGTRSAPLPLGSTADGGDERNRTADPLLAKQVLSQLSYIPTSNCRLVILDWGPNIANHKSEIDNPAGGPSWDRTRDLTLIKRAL